MKIKKAGFIAFPASDFEASLAFYRDLLEIPIQSQGTDDFSRFAHWIVTALVSVFTSGPNLLIERTQVCNYSSMM